MNDNNRGYGNVDHVLDQVERARWHRQAVPVRRNMSREYADLEGLPAGQRQMIIEQRRKQAITDPYVLQVMDEVRRSPHVVPSDQAVNVKEGMVENITMNMQRMHSGPERMFAEDECNALPPHQRQQGMQFMRSMGRGNPQMLREQMPGGPMQMQQYGMQAQQPQFVTIRPGTPVFHHLQVNGFAAACPLLKEIGPAMPNVAQEQFQVRESFNGFVIPPGMNQVDTARIQANRQFLALQGRAGVIVVEAQHVMRPQGPQMLRDNVQRPMPQQQMQGQRPQLITDSRVGTRPSIGTPQRAPNGKILLG